MSILTSSSPTLIMLTACLFLLVLGVKSAIEAVLFYKERKRFDRALRRAGL